MLEFFHFIMNLAHFFESIQNVFALIFYFYTKINHEHYFGFANSSAHSSYRIVVALELKIL